MPSRLLFAPLLLLIFSVSPGSDHADAATIGTFNTAGASQNGELRYYWATTVYNKTRPVTVQFDYQISNPNGWGNACVALVSPSKVWTLTVVPPLQTTPASTQLAHFSATFPVALANTHIEIGGRTNGPSTQLTISNIRISY